MVNEDGPPPGQTEGTEAVHIRTFFIADVRGYTLFTQERGDEVAAKLAAKFAEIKGVSDSWHLYSVASD